MFRTRLCKMVESDNVPNPYQKVRYGKPSPLIAALEQVPKSRAIAGSVGAAMAVSFIIWAIMIGSGEKVPTMTDEWKAVLATVASFFNQQIICQKSALQMSFGDKIGKFVGIAAMGVALAGPVVPLPAIADGAVSASTVFRARTKYGPKLLSLVDSASKGDFAAFEDKKTVNAFDLFISSSNALGGKISKERKSVEKSLEAQIYSAVKAKDASKLTAAIKEFVSVADLKPDFKEGELGQTDSSGYSPTWGTPRQYIYQR
eukprot:gene29494-38597_t